MCERREKRKSIKEEERGRESEIVATSLDCSLSSSVSIISSISATGRAESVAPKKTLFSKYFES